MLMASWNFVYKKVSELCTQSSTTKVMYILFPHNISLESPGQIIGLIVIFSLPLGEMDEGEGLFRTRSMLIQEVMS